MNPLRKIKRLRKALKVDDRKPVLQIIYEYLAYKFTRPELAAQYFNKYLFRNEVDDPADYIVTPDLEEKVWYYNDMKYKSILTEKHITEFFFSEFNLPVVRSFAYNDNHLFFTGNDLKLINNSDEFKNFMLHMKKKGEWKGEHMIVKMNKSSYGGMNIYRVSLNEIKRNRSKLDDLYNQVINSGYLFQDVVDQHPELNKITPNSLNTVRIDTFTDNEGRTKIFNTTIRFGRGKSFLDNVSHGGMFAGIDIETGLMKGEAFSNFEKGNGQVLSAHPLTGQAFRDFKIPFFNEAKQLALKAARLIPEARVVGWDICITPDGPVLLEGNYFNGLYRLEIGQHGFKNNSAFQQLLKELDVYYNDEGNSLEELKKLYPLYV